MGTALYRKPDPSRRRRGDEIYPYLLRDLKIDRANRVWAADIPCIPMRKGFVYLFAVMDWHSRRVLAWRLSNTFTTDFCLDTVREALHRYGRPEIFNTDQGCQFTSADFTDLLKDNGIQISMDGKGCWRDHVFVERLWRSVKYEEVYLKAYDSVADAKAHLGTCLRFYNEDRPHRAHERRPPSRWISAHSATKRRWRHDDEKAGSVDLWTIRFAHRAACRGKVLRLSHRAALRLQAPPSSCGY